MTFTNPTRIEDAPWPVMTRDEAYKEGHKYYWSGTPCKNGHISQRYVKTGACRECQRVNSLKRNLKYQHKYTTKTVINIEVHPDDVQELQTFALELRKRRSMGQRPAKLPMPPQQHATPKQAPPMGMRWVTPFDVVIDGDFIFNFNTKQVDIYAYEQEEQPYSELLESIEADNCWPCRIDEG